MGEDERLRLKSEQSGIEIPSGLRTKNKRTTRQRENPLKELPYRGAGWEKRLGRKGRHVGVGRLKRF